MNKENLHTIFSNLECLSEERILAYCTNKLTNLERNEVERHTINCKFCSDALEGFEKKIHTFVFGWTFIAFVQQNTSSFVESYNVVLFSKNKIENIIYNPKQIKS